MILSDVEKALPASSTKLDHAARGLSTSQDGMSKSQYSREDKPLR